MRWFEKQRRIWMCEFIAKNGHINRQDLMNQFGISLPQASTDLGKLRDEFPELLVYNTRRKRYETKDIT